MSQPGIPPGGHQCLAGVRVVVLTSGHEVLDSRVYGREALSLAEMGASVTVVGELTRGKPGAAVAVRPVPPAANRGVRFLLQPWRCLWKARDLRPDIVHVHDAEMLAVLPVARLLWRRTKFVYDVHEDFANLMLIRDWLPSRVRPIVRALTDLCEKTLARLTHGIVAVTPPLMERFPQRHRVTALNFPTHDFLEAARRKMKPPRDRTYDVVHLGTLSRRRAAFLAEVLGDLERRRPGTRSLVVGTTLEILDFLQGRLPQGCEARGPISHAEVPGILADAKVGIDVHPWLDPHLEPALAVKVCEYMACGCAVVASGMPVLEEVLSEADSPLAGIRTLHSAEPGDYVAALVGLLETIDRGADPGMDLRRFAEQHMDWDHEALKIAALYRSLLDGTPCAT